MIAQKRVRNGLLQSADRRVRLHRTLQGRGRGPRRLLDVRRQEGRGRSVPVRLRPAETEWLAAAEDQRFHQAVTGAPTLEETIEEEPETPESVGKHELFDAEEERRHFRPVQVARQRRVQDEKLRRIVETVHHKHNHRGRRLRQLRRVGRQQIRRSVPSRRVRTMSEGYRTSVGVRRVPVAEQVQVIREKR